MYVYCYGPVHFYHGFTYCIKTCTQPGPTNPSYIEPGDIGLTRGACFVASRPQWAAVTVLLSLGGLLDARFVLFHVWGAWQAQFPCVTRHWSLTQSTAKTKFKHVDD